MGGGDALLSRAVGEVVHVERGSEDMNNFVPVARASLGKKETG
jgi:hypothetical protein